eukprot:6146607-Alexandrium_andersonii.AAC.1
MIVLTPLTFWNVRKLSKRAVFSRRVEVGSSYGGPPSAALVGVRLLSCAAREPEIPDEGSNRRAVGLDLSLRLDCTRPDGRMWAIVRKA